MTDAPILSPDPKHSMLAFVTEGIITGPLTFEHIQQAGELMDLVENCPSWLEAVGNVVLIPGPVNLEAVREMAKGSLITDLLETMS